MKLKTIEKFTIINPAKTWKPLILGWAYGYFCRALDQGIDPRHIELPTVLEQLDHDIVDVNSDRTAAQEFLASRMISVEEITNFLEEQKIVYSQDDTLVSQCKLEIVKLLLYKVEPTSSDVPDFVEAE